MPNLGAPELIIIAIVLLVLFGGAKLAGLGKSTGRALREFKEETKGLNDKEKSDEEKAAATGELSAEPSTPPAAQPTRAADPVDAEVVETKPRTDR